MNRVARSARVDWAYLRPGCESCVKARAELDARGLDIAATRSTRDALTDSEARELLDGLDEVRILGAGGGVRQPGAATSVDDLRGPTGGLRAPMLRRGRRLLVGFRAAALKEWLDSTD